MFFSTHHFVKKNCFFLTDSALLLSLLVILLLFCNLLWWASNDFCLFASFVCFLCNSIKIKIFHSHFGSLSFQRTQLIFITPEAAMKRRRKISVRLVEARARIRVGARRAVFLEFLRALYSRVNKRRWGGLQWCFSNKKQRFAEDSKVGELLVPRRDWAPIGSWWSTQNPVRRGTVRSVQIISSKKLGTKNNLTLFLEALSTSVLQLSSAYLYCACPWSGLIALPKSTVIREAVRHTIVQNSTVRLRKGSPSSLSRRCVYFY